MKEWKRKSDGDWLTDSAMAKCVAYIHNLARIKHSNVKSWSWSFDWLFKKFGTFQRPRRHVDVEFSAGTCSSWRCSWRCCWTRCWSGPPRLGWRSRGWWLFSSSGDLHVQFSHLFKTNEWIRVSEGGNGNRTVASYNGYRFLALSKKDYGNFLHNILQIFTKQEGHLFL